MMEQPVLTSGSLSERLFRCLDACHQFATDLLFPWECIVCGFEGHELHGPLCTSCRASLLSSAARTRSFACPRCALPGGPFVVLDKGCPECRNRALGFDRAMALGLYEGPIRELCLLLKQERNAWLVPWLGELFVQTCQSDLTQLPPNTWIIPIPLHWRRRLQRGYNQAEALAEDLAWRLNLKVHRPLRRIKPTSHLTTKTAAERMEIMRGVFQVLRPPNMKSKTVLLVDDILTTGATCGAAARVLKQAGAKQVIVAVLGRTA